VEEYLFRNCWYFVVDAVETVAVFLQLTDNLYPRTEIYVAVCCARCVFCAGFGRRLVLQGEVDESGDEVEGLNETPKLRQFE
jgi:hypothetical protein